MGVPLQKKVSLDVAATNNSGDSFSFTGLICIQEQHSKLQSIKEIPVSKNANPMQQEDTEFEFSSVMTNPVIDLNNNSPADSLLINGKLQTQAVCPVQSKNPPRVTDHNVVKNSSVKYGNNGKASRVNSKKVIESKRPVSKVTHEAKKEQVNRNRSSRRGTFGSIFSSCKECRTLEPSSSMREQRVQSN